MRYRLGFTFVEVLAAVMIVALTAMIIGAAVPLGTRAQASTSYRMVAMGLAQKVTEGIKSAGYANATGTALFNAGLLDSATPVSGTTFSFTTADALANDTPAALLPSGVGRVLIEQPTTELRRVTVTVTWSENGRSRSFSTGTLLASL